ncbi:MAG: EAL domain-containing protein [Oscillospiraceae bacterium]
MIGAKNKILIVDDNSVNRKILAKILSDDYESIEAENGKEALDILMTHSAELSAVMLDIIMPVMDGYEFLKKIKENERYNNVPIIITTGNSDSENEIKTLELGAWDFVSKPYNAKIIKFRLKNAIDRSQLGIFNQLKYLAEFDTLTNIYNKSKFFMETERMLKKYSDEDFAFIRLDIDRFQLINSYFGTSEGDRMLMYIASQVMMIETYFEKTTYGRIESDIFGVCVPYNKKIIEEFIRSFRESLSEYNTEYDIVPSVGIYIIKDSNKGVETYYNKATLASKAVKGNYIDYFAYYNTKMSDKLKAEQEITNEMNYALDNGQFKIYFQAKYSLHDSKPAGCEALVRWIHPKKGMLSPADFIPVFEKNGFIMKLDYFVWESACKSIRKWMDEGKPVTPVSVNISRVDIYNPKFVDNMIELVEKYGIPTSSLNLELTESAYTDNPIVMLETVKKLQEHGFVIMMDDFGSGYSSLNILKDIPVDILKIDMRFLSKTEIVGRGENIIASVVRMAKWLNIPVIVEGVETKPQVDFLRSIGCEFVQGYYFAKPEPIDEYEKRMAGNSAADLRPIERRKEMNKFNADSIWSTDAQMEMLFSNVLQPILIYEFQNDRIEILRVNGAFYEMLGYDDLAIKLDNPLSAIEPIYRAVVLNAFNSVIKTEETAECEYIRHLANGKSLWILLKLKYINKIGEKHVILGALSDITVQKQFDAELNKRRKAIDYRTDIRTILIVDDDEINRVILKEIFQNDYRVLEATNGEDAIEILNENKNYVDLILLNIITPKMDSEEFLKYKNLNEAIVDIPVILITADENQQVQMNTLSLGANDYIVKPFIGEVVLKRVNNVIDSGKRFSEIIKEYNDVVLRSQLDQMTGVYNRSTAEELIKTILKNSDNTYAMIMLDIDNFKQINDTYGHAYGDDVLRRLAQLLHSFFRQGDIVARMGGDEFLVFMTNAPSQKIVELKCKELLYEIQNSNTDKTKIFTLCSLGIAISNDKSNTFELLYENADSALYEAKKNGKNQCSIYNNEPWVECE